MKITFLWWAIIEASPLALSEVDLAASAPSWPKYLVFDVSYPG